MSGTVNLGGPSSGKPPISRAVFNAEVNRALETKVNVTDAQATAATTNAALTQKANVADVQTVATATASVQNITVANQQALTTSGLSLAFLSTALATAQARATAAENRLTVLETATPPPATSNAVATFTLGATTNTTQVLNWTAPASGPAPTSYQTRVAPAGTGTWSNGPSVGAGVFTATVTGLTQGTLYDYGVVSVNAAGPGGVSATLTRATTATFTPSPAWTEITNNSGTITMDDGGQVTIVNGAVKLTPLGGSIGNMGTTSSVILVLKSDIGRIFQESNDPSLIGNPGNVGWWWWDVTTPWVWTADPRVITPPVGVLRNPNTIPFASNSVWNIGIGNSATWVASGAAETTTLHGLALGINTTGFGQPIYFGTTSDPLVTFSNVGQGQTGFAPWSRQFHCPAGAVPASGSDGHMNVYDSTHPLEALSMLQCTSPDFGNLRNGSVVSSFLGGDLDLTKNGTNGTLDPPPLDYTGTDNYLAGVITSYDLGQGVIRHAIRCAISQAQLFSPNPDDGSGAGVEWPNYHVDYFHGPSVYAGNLPVGTYGIPGTVDVTTLGLSAGGLMLAHCLQDYGAIWRDQGGTNQFTIYSVPEQLGNARFAEMVSDWPTIRAQLRRMANQSAGNVNGGGARRVALLSPVG